MGMNLLRRRLLLASLLLLRPLAALAALWNKAGFDAKTVDGALQSVGISAPIPHSDDIEIHAPTIAEDGSVVPIEAASRIPGTRRLLFVVDKNPYPLVADFEFAEGALPDMGIRLKFGETSAIRVIAEADGRFYANQVDVKVTAGGCGG
jgi:sulfur-oxidizing protein SoxY